MRDRAYFFRRNLTPLQIGLLVLVGILIAAVEVVIFLAYFNLDTAATAYEKTSVGTTNLANVQRESLLLEIKSDDYLVQEAGDIQLVEIQRAILANHLQITKAQLNISDNAAARLEGIDQTLADYDAWFETIPVNGTDAERHEAQERLEPIVKRLDLQVKELYDSEEQAFFNEISAALRTQRRVQTLLIGTSIAVLVLSAVSGFSLRRSISAEFERAYRQLEAEVAVRKQSEIGLEQARDQALQASRFKSQLLAKVSHELRTPLGAIMGYTELLQNGVFGPLQPQQQRITAEVIDSTDYLTKLVGELLDQAQSESGATQLYVRPFEPAVLLQQVETQMGVLAGSKGLALVMAVADDLPQTLLGDRERLQQILVNLVGNAIKFTDRGRVVVRLYRPDVAKWAIAVSDTGIGIPREAQNYVFEPFRQVDGSLTRQYSGTGLGLTIVRQLVALMGGEIKLESEAGRGSTFTVVLPLEMAAIDTADMDTATISMS